MIKVVKIGGNVVDDPQALARFCDDFAALRGPKALVHGGGKEATRLSGRLGVATTMLQGRRVTDAATLEVVTMVYAGLVNKRIVAMLQARGCNAIGLSGADANAITATRRPATPVDYGFVGDIDPAGVDGEAIAALIEQGLVPVFCAITHDGHGQLLNCNADTVARSVALGLAGGAEKVGLVYCFEKDGVLSDPDDDASVIPTLDPASYDELRARGSIHSGMIPKIDNAFDSLRRGVATVTIKSAANLLRDLGTTITR